MVTKLLTRSLKTNEMTGGYEAQAILNKKKASLHTEQGDASIDILSIFCKSSLLLK